MRGRCSVEARAVCPLMEHYTDTHHLEFPASRSHTKVQRRWRDLSFNKITVCRGVHQAIHASGYIPERPDRDEMLQEIWSNETPVRAQRERITQLAIGEVILQHTDYDGDVA